MRQDEHADGDEWSGPAPGGWRGGQADRRDGAPGRPATRWAGSAAPLVASVQTGSGQRSLRVPKLGRLPGHANAEFARIPVRASARFARGTGPRMLARGRARRQDCRSSVLGEILRSTFCVGLRAWDNSSSPRERQAALTIGMAAYPRRPALLGNRFTATTITQARMAAKIAMAERAAVANLDIGDALHGRSIRSARTRGTMHGADQHPRLPCAKRSLSDPARDAGVSKTQNSNIAARD